MSDERPLTNIADDLEPLVLLEDEPVESWRQDELGLLHFSRIIAAAALGTRGPFTIGVYGAWGEGKTSVLKQAQSLLERKSGDQENIVTVWFNAWQYEHEEHPIVPLVASIVDQIEKHVYTNRTLELVEKDVILSGLAKIGRALRAVAYGFSAKAKLKVPGVAEIEAGLVAEKMVDRYKELNRPPDPLLDRTLYYNAFDALKEAIPKETREGDPTKAPRIVVFIDDLDRCLPDKALRLLESIKLVLTQQGFIYVLAVYKPVIAELIEAEIWKQLGGNERARSALASELRDQGVQYLDKIIQLPLPLPSHESRFEDYVTRLLERDAFKEDAALCETVAKITDVIAPGINHNPRSFVRLINNLIVDRNLYFAMNPDQEDNDVIGLFAVSRILQLQLPPVLFDHLTRHQDVCQSILVAKEARSLVEESGDAEEEKAGRRLRQDKLTDQLLQTLADLPHLFELLDSKPGRRWLENEELRTQVTQFLSVTRNARPEDEAEVRPQTQEEIVDNAVRRSFRLDVQAPVTADHRSTVMWLGLEYAPFNDSGMAYVCAGDFPFLVSLRLYGTQVTDAGLVHLASLSKLTKLNLSDTQVTDVGLMHLAGLSSLTELYLNNTQMTDAGLVHLAGLSSLTGLYLNNTQVTDAGLVHLAGLSSLTELYLNNTQVTDVELVHLAGLSSLTELYLNNTQVTDAALVHLARLSKLTTLSLSRTQVTDAGLEHLAGLSSLTALRLDGTQLTDTGLVHLAGLTSLTTLYLQDTQVTDAGLEHLAGLSSLTTLNLRGTQLTDAGLEHLAGLSSLTTLWLNSTQVTDAGVKKLKAAIPKCRIVH